LLDKPWSGDETEFTYEQLSRVTFCNDAIYRHKVLRVNYTTYDVRRAQDSLNPRTHADFMVLAQEDNINGSLPHPYWYGRIIGIFHADVRYLGPSSRSMDSQRMDFLWVRWFRRDLSYNAGFHAKRLHRIEFVSGENPEAFGFVDPSQIIRAVHLIPAFMHGRTSELLGPSIARQPKENDEDWRFYNVALYVYT
jgi:hypothetical protein